MKETGFGSKNPRIRQEAVKWLAQIHAAYPSFSFKSYTPFLMGMLEDSSETVRETAKEVVVDLFWYICPSRLTLRSFTTDSFMV